jgi:hypothetical protein
MPHSAEFQISRCAGLQTISCILAAENSTPKVPAPPTPRHSALDPALHRRPRAIQPARASRSSLVAPRAPSRAAPELSGPRWVGSDKCKSVLTHLILCQYWQRRRRAARVWRSVARRRRLCVSILSVCFLLESSVGGCLAARRVCDARQERDLNKEVRLDV